MKIKFLLGFAWLFVCQEIKTIEPITMMVIGGAAMTVRAISKTTTGKVLIGWAICRAAATPSGKYFIGVVQNRAGLMLQHRAQSRRADAIATFKTNLLAMRNRMTILIPGFLKNTDVPAQGAAHTVSQTISGSSENSGILEALRKFRKDLTVAMKEDLAAARDGSGAFKARAAMPEGATGAGSTVHVNLNQTSIHQALHVAPGATFVHADAVAAGEYAKKQFWKGAFFGGAVGAGAMAWLDKKREERAMCDFFDNE